MSSFYIKPTGIRSLDSSFTSMENNLNGMIEDINRISNTLHISGSSSAVIRQALRQSSASVRNNRNALHCCCRVLMEIVSQYEHSEQIAGDFHSGDSTTAPSGNSHSDTVDQALLNDLRKMIENLPLWQLLILLSMLGPYLTLMTGALALLKEVILAQIDKLISNANYINQIKDESTRQALSNYPDYVNVIREKYEQSSGKAREVFEKYFPDMKIRTMESSDGSSYNHVDDVFDLDQSQVNDERGANKIFYHEYGHYLVDQNGWVYTDENGVRRESESFRKFHESLDREAKAYIKSVEDDVRNELTGQYGNRLTPSQIEQLVHDRASERMRAEIGQPDSQVNAIQDIISGASDDSYNIGYGHSRSYWHADPTRQGNEGFAQFYTIDFNQSPQELEFIKRHMPETYKQYQALLDEALNN